MAIQKHTPHKELYDPFAHYIRGVLSFDERGFTFVAYRMPYVELNDKKWDSEQAFLDDYRRMVANKYVI